MPIAAPEGELDVEMSLPLLPIYVYMGFDFFLTMLKIKVKAYSNIYQRTTSNGNPRVGGNPTDNSYTVEVPKAANLHLSIKTDPQRLTHRQPKSRKDICEIS